MTRYTVTATRVAEDELAELWLKATDRAAVASAADTIDKMLRDDAVRRGDDTGLGVRQLIVSPLLVEFSVSELDRLVTVWSFRHIRSISNGH